MDELSKNIINYLNEHRTGTGDCWCSLASNWDSEADVTIASVAEAAGVEIADVRACAKYLCEKNQAEYIYLNSRSGKVAVAFHLKHEGRHFHEFSSLTTKQKWKERGIGAGVTLLIWLIQELIKYYSPI